MYMEGGSWQGAALIICFIWLVRSRQLKVGPDGAGGCLVDLTENSTLDHDIFH
jgi:hypothetical protein